MLGGPRQAASGSPRTASNPPMSPWAQTPWTDAHTEAQAMAGGSCVPSILPTSPEPGQRSTRQGTVRVRGCPPT